MSATHEPEHLKPEVESNSISSHPLRSICFRKSTASPLLRLPAELREQIWHHVFSDLWIKISEDLETDKLRSKTHTFHEVSIDASLPTSHRHFNSGVKNIFALPLTCRQIYSETHLLPYTFSVFEFLNVDALGTFLSRLDDIEDSETQTELLHCSIRDSVRTIMPPTKWLDWVFEGSEPNFTSLFPNLKKIYLDGRKMSKDGFEMTYCVSSLRISEEIDVVVLDLEDTD